MGSVSARMPASMQHVLHACMCWSVNSTCRYMYVSCSRFHPDAHTLYSEDVRSNFSLNRTTEPNRPGAVEGYTLRVAPRLSLPPARGGDRCGCRNFHHVCVRRSGEGAER
eukprot:365190-Chlamydomonas_euryale.AAC.4